MPLETVASAFACARASAAFSSSVFSGTTGASGSSLVAFEESSVFLTSDFVGVLDAALPVSSFLPHVDAAPMRTSTTKTMATILTHLGIGFFGGCSGDGEGLAEVVGG